MARVLDVDACPVFKVGLVRFTKHWVKGFLELDGTVQTRHAESYAELEPLKWVGQLRSFL